MAARSYEEWVEHIRSRPIPEHVAIVPDGNGRWALKRGLSRPLGHRAGVEALRAVIRAALDIGVKYLTLYSFSTENWSRSQEEVSALMGLLVEYLESGIRQNKEHGVGVRVIGRRDTLKPHIRRAISQAEAETQGPNKMTLIVAFNYGGRAEIIDAAKTLMRKAMDGTLTPDDLDEESFSRELYTAGLKDPDVVIRTSGEIRMSNFLLWQAAYAEYVPSLVLWPDFTPEEFFSCIEQYQSRDRRFGGVSSQR